VKVITFSKKVTVLTTHGEHKVEISANPGERLVFDDDNALTIQQNPGSASYIFEVTDLGPLLRELPPVRNWRRRRVLFYRNRGIGDQLICSALSRFYREILGAEAFQLSDRVHEPIWAYNPYIGNVPLSMPMHLDPVWRAPSLDLKTKEIIPGKPFMHGAYFFESATEWDNDSEQPNIYDRLFGMCGIDPSRVPAKFKRPIFSLQTEDINKRLDWLRQVGAAMNKDLTGGYIFLQIQSTNKVRSMPASLTERVLAALNEFAVDRKLPILCGGSVPFAPEIATLIAKTPMAINVATTMNNLRLYGAIVGGASLVLGPDSSALHFAAAFEVPAVGFWGPFSPRSRTRYYPNQIHLYHPDLCPACPCYNYLPELPIGKCPRGALQTSCEVYEGISYGEISEAVNNLLPLVEYSSRLLPATNNSSAPVLASR
jgi:ADP-heptose:LPS heptosyltransferase